MMPLKKMRCTGGFLWRTIRFSGAALLAAGLLSGSALAETTKFNFFSGSSPHFSLVFVADTKGLFKAQGLDVSVKTFGSGTAASEAFRAGHAAFVTTGDLPAIKFWQIGDTQGLASVETDSDLMVMAAAKNIRSPADLRGKKVATRMKSTGEFMVMKYLALGDVSPKDVTLVNMAPPDMVIALDRGDICAFFIWQPYGWQARQVSRDKVHLLATKLVNEYMILSTSKKFAGENPGSVVKTLKALDAASRYIKGASPGQVADILRKYTRANKDLIVRMLPSMKLRLIDGPVFRKDMNALAQFMITSGSLERHIDWKKDYNDSFLRQVKPALFK